MPRKSPEDRARSALDQVMKKLEFHRQECVRLEGVLRDMGVTVAGQAAPRLVPSAGDTTYPGRPPFRPLEDQVENNGPKGDLAPADELGEGRWA